MSGVHKNPTISFRISDYERREIEARIKASGMMKKTFHKMYDEIIETGQIKEKESPVDGEAYTDIEELQHDYLAMIKTVVDMLDGAKYLWQK